MRPWDLSGVRLAGDPLALGAELRSRALTAVERAPGTSDSARGAGTRIVEGLNDPYGRLARGVLLLSDPTYLAAWSKLARNPVGGHHEWDPDECHAVRQVRRWAGSRENRAMSLTDAGGGHLVPFQLDPTVTIAANGSVNQIRQVARQVIATTDRWNGVSSGAVAWSYDAEATEVSDDSPTYSQPSIPIFKAQGFVPVSVELFEDAPNATQAVADALAFGKDVLEAGAFTNGTGVGMPTGIVHRPDRHVLGDSGGRRRCRRARRRVRPARLPALAVRLREYLGVAGEPARLQHGAATRRAGRRGLGRTTRAGRAGDAAGPSPAGLR